MDVEPKDALEKMIVMAVADMHSDELQQVKESLPYANEAALEEYVKRYSMGYWLLESFIEYDIDLHDTLNRYMNCLIREEKEEARERQLLEQSIRASQ